MADTGRNLLLCTLGMSWPVVPESYALLAPEKLPLYRQHPQRAQIEAIRATYALVAPDQLWLCTTDATEAMLARVHAWWQALGAPCPLRIWRAGGSGDLADADQVRRMRELTLRLTLLAAEYCGGNGQLVLSLAGGRKTMSADLQRAGQLFGCHAMLHIIGPSGFPPAPLDGKSPKNLAQPLPSDIAGGVMPLVVGAGQRSELLDVALDSDRPSVCADRFALPHAGSPTLTVGAEVLDTATLDRELAEREQAGASLFGNFIRAIDQSAPHGVWRSLYRLPPRIIERLKATLLDHRSRDWLIALPKAELHCHLGGMLDLAAQQRVATALWQALLPDQQQAARQRVGDWLNRDWPVDWPRRLRDTAGEGLRHACAALLLNESDLATLQRELFQATEPRVALKSRRGFEAYEQPGELSGSALLQHESAIEPYAREIVRAARAQGLRYLELRGSPHKYLDGDGAGFLRCLHHALREQAGDEDPKIRFIVIIDRRHPQQAAEVVEMTVAAHDTLPEFIAGLDLAGAEGTTDPEMLARAFEPAFVRCLPVTIHAGEGEPAENIWQAAYRLHADRIGHGLTLADNRPLLQRFRDRGITLELCPSSNREVVGFRDPAVPDSAGYGEYPLAKLREQGLRLALCTDNPGISRTTLADEYLTAARMTPGGLTRWDALGLIRQSFRGAFLPAAERTQMMKTVDLALFHQLLGL